MTCTTNNYVTQSAGALNLDMYDDNDLVFSVDWNFDITGYSFAANIVPKDSDAEIPMTINILNPTLGTMNVVITKASITDISPSTNRWYMNWTTPAPESYVRTILAGSLILRSK